MRRPPGGRGGEPPPRRRPRARIAATAAGRTLRAAGRPSKATARSLGASPARRPPVETLLGASSFSSAPEDSATATSFAAGKRAVGSSDRQRRIVFSHEGDRSGTAIRGDGGGSVIRFTRTDSEFSPLCGRSPVTISYITTPKA